jgi:glycine/D-amino acid oxidase-like deaminating enzyme/nitrite reductase/ring-hydroxylating ferredoxin subunit
MVVDRGRFGRGMSARTTAHLAFELDDYFHELAKSHGRNAARLWRESQSAAVDRIEAIVAQEGLACDFARVDGYLVPARSEDTGLLRKELLAAREAGIVDAEWLEVSRSPAAEQPAIRFPRQARFHPLKYLDGLVGVLQRRGARLHDLTAIASLEEESGHVVAKTDDGWRVRATQVVVATNTPFHLKIPVHTKQAPYRTFAIAGRVPPGSVPRALYWDAADPYHYVRLADTAEGELLIVGGEDHKTGHHDDAEERWRCLEEWTRARFPLEAVLHRWSGQVLEPVDSLAFLGRDPAGLENVYVATGDSGHGMTHGTIAGLLITDLIAGRENAWATLYDPSRITVSAGREFLRENLNVAAQYADWVKAGDAAASGEVLPGDGAVLRRGLKLIAAFRDETGRLHERSATCPHLGCVVDWNRAEKTWDCPCHGSRFAAVDGRVLNGPAVSGLAAVEDGGDVNTSEEPEPEPTEA